MDDKTLTPFEIKAIREFIAESEGQWLPYACEDGIGALQAFIRDMLAHVDRQQVTIRAYELNSRHMDRLQALFGGDWDTTGESLAGTAADTIKAQQERIKELEAVIRSLENALIVALDELAPDVRTDHAEINERGKKALDGAYDARKALGEGE